MVDPDVKFFVCFVARRNSMKLMVGWVKKFRSALEQEAEESGGAN